MLGAGPGAPPPSEVACKAQGCGKLACKRQRWCQDHRRAYAAMMAQYKREGRESEFKELMTNEVRAAMLMQQWESENPLCDRWARKRMLDLTQFQRTFEASQRQAEREGETPLTESEFMIWACSTKGLTPSGGAKWWRELLTTAERDNKGRDAEGNLGELRLWVVTDESKLRETSKKVANSVQQSSRQFKDVDPGGLQDLQHFALHASSQGNSKTVNFLHGKVDGGSVACLPLPDGQVTSSPESSSKCLEERQTPNKQGQAGQDRFSTGSSMLQFADLHGGDAKIESVPRTAASLAISEVVDVPLERAKLAGKIELEYHTCFASLTEAAKKVASILAAAATDSAATESAKTKELDCTSVSSCCPCV